MHFVRRNLNYYKNNCWLLVPSTPSEETLIEFLESVMKKGDKIHSRGARDLKDDQGKYTRYTSEMSFNAGGIRAEIKIEGHTSTRYLGGVNFTHRLSENPTERERNGFHNFRVSMFYNGSVTYLGTVELINGKKALKVSNRLCDKCGCGLIEIYYSPKNVCEKCKKKSK